MGLCFQNTNTKKSHTAKHLGKWPVFVRTVSERLNFRRAKAFAKPLKIKKRVFTMLFGDRWQGRKECPQCS